MRARQEVLKTCAALLALLLSVGCAHTATRGSQPETRRLIHGAREIEVDTASGDVVPLLGELARQGLSASAIWKVPGEPAMRLAVVERPATETSYGPQLVALRVGGEVRVLHQSPRLYDDDFVAPTFFRFSDRTLLLADHGSEDAYGVLAWSIESGGVRDLGELPVALPEGEDVFARGAAPTARVELQHGRYVITIPGPVLLHPRGEEERVLAKKGEVVTFEESAGRFEIAQR
jgi:hypothetical protein